MRKILLKLEVIKILTFHVVVNKIRKNYLFKRTYIIEAKFFFFETYGERVEITLD